VVTGLHRSDALPDVPAEGEKTAAFGGNWRATVDETGHYSFAVTL
jgi:hypothetical protein